MQDLGEIIVVVERVQIKGMDELDRTLKSTVKAAKNLKPYWNMVKSIIWKNTAARFKAKGGSRGKWAALSHATIQLRQFNRSSAAPLQDSGMLLKSVTTKESVKKETPLSLIIGTNLRYADVQQEGFKIRVTPGMRRFYIARGLTPGPITGDDIEVPARPFLYVDSKDRKEMDKALKFYFGLVMKKSSAKGSAGGS